MKKITFAVIMAACALFVLAGCKAASGPAVQEVASPAETEEYIEATEVQTETLLVVHTETQTETWADTNPKTEETSETIPTIVRNYIDNYRAEHIFRSVLVPIDYFLISDEYVIFVRAIEGADTVSIMEIPDIERIEDQNVAGYHTVRIFDKTGTELSIAVYGEDAQQIQNIIKNANGN